MCDLHYPCMVHYEIIKKTLLNASHGKFIHILNTINVFSGNLKICFPSEIEKNYARSRPSQLYETGPLV